MMTMFFIIDRTGSRSGVAIYVKSCLSVTILHAVTLPKCFKFIAVELNVGLASLLLWLVSADLPL